MRILVVEDDPGIGFLLETILATHKYAVDVVTDGQAGLDLSDAYEYDAILLDVSLPKKDGISVCREIRAKGNTVPILLLTSLDSAANRTRGLDAGADDYVSKPFDRDELLARLRAILRRRHAPTVPILSWGSLQLDPASTDVTFGDRSVPVTPKEYALLELFLRNSKRVFSCNAILDHLWSFDAPGQEVIRTHIKGLRHKLKQVGATADFIETVYGIGYRLKPIDSSGTTLLDDTWEKFKGQVHEQVAILEQLAVRFFNQDLQSDWQTIGKNIAHSLTGSLGTFGFSLSSELARQIEKLLGSDLDLTAAQGQLLLSLVTALREELDRPIVTTDLHSFAPDLMTDILLVSADKDLNYEIQSMATGCGWHVQIVPTIAAARSQLQRDRTRSILLTEAVIGQTEAVLGLLVDINKQVPLVPVIALTNPDRLDPVVQHLGNWTSVCPTKIADLMAEIDRAIAEAESTQTHVLVVDDDLKILAILRALLLPWGFKITTLADSQKFWEILPVCKPDLLILDIEMPIVSGLDLCQSIRDRAEYSSLPIIFLTAHTEPELIQQVFAIGANDFVAKPVVGPEIIARITNLMERKLLTQTDRAPLTVNFPAILTMTQAQFDEVCQANQELRIERTAQGEAIVMPPAFSDAGNRNFNIAAQLGVWTERNGTGIGFDSSAGFTLLNGATRSPDASWIKLERWNALTATAQASFAPICPDFAIELRSASDTLISLQTKMQEYIDNGALLGWLIDRKNRQVYIYRPDRLPEILEQPELVTGDPELPGFGLKMAKIW